MNQRKALFRPCPICRGASGEILNHQSFVLPDGHPISEGYDIVFCDICGFVFADLKINQQDLDQYYSEQSKYEDKFTSSGGGTSWWDRERLHSTANVISKYVIDSETTKIIDIGCANGGLLFELQQAGVINLCGLDPSMNCVKNTRNLGISAYQGSLFALPTEVNKFNIVILSHVLEHIYDLIQAVQQIGHLLSDEGLVYVEVPDAMRYTEFLVAPFQDFNTEHINHFAATHIMNLFFQAGYILLGMEQKNILSAPDILYPAFYAVFRKSSGWQEVKIIKDSGLREEILSYIRSSKNLLDQINIKLISTLSNEEPIVVWGTGQLTMKLLSETILGKFPIKTFIDSNPIHQGKRLNGIPISGPLSLKNIDNPILVASLINQHAILLQIEDMQLKNKVLLLL